MKDKIYDLVNMRAYFPVGEEAHRLLDDSESCMNNLAFDTSYHKELFDQHHQIYTTFLGLKKADKCYFYTSGSQSNLYAIYSAQCHRPGKVLMSTCTHTGVGRALHMMHIPFKIFDLTSCYVFDAQEVIFYIMQYHHDISCIVITVGTTCFGHIEIDTVSILDVCARYHIWVHIDAAWGATFYGLQGNVGSLDVYHSIVQHPAVTSCMFDRHKCIGFDDTSVLLYYQNDLLPTNIGFSYFKIDHLFYLTTRGIRGVKMTLDLLEGKGKDRCMKRVADTVRYASTIKRMLIDAGIQLFVPYETSILAILCNNYDHMISLIDALVQDDIFVGRILYNTSSGSQYFGIKLVFTCDQFYHPQDLEYIAQRIIMHYSSIGT